MSVPTSGQEPRPERAPHVAGAPSTPPERGSARDTPPEDGSAPGTPPTGGHHLTPPPRRKRPWIVLAVAVAVVGGIVALAVLAHHESRTPVEVSYRVTGSARSVDVAYSTWDDQVITATREKGVALPWQKEITTTGFSRGGSLTVTLGASGGTATCSAVVQGKTYTATATGPFATAQCRGF